MPSPVPVTQAPEPPARQRGAMRSPLTWVIVLGAALGAGAWILLRRRSSSAAGTATSTSDTPAGTTSPDWSGEIATLQTEIMDLQSSEAQDKDSDSDDMVTVPDVAGVDVEQATQILRAAGLKASGPAGKPGVVHVVTRQAPAAGAKVAKGKTVTLTTRTEPENKLVTSSKPPITKPGRRPPPKPAPKPKAAAHTTTRKAA